MKREFDSVESFAQFLSDDLKDFMTELAPDVEQVLLNHIRSDIYGAYTPQSYDRRYELWDGKNIDCRPVKVQRFRLIVFGTNRLLFSDGVGQRLHGLGISEHQNDILDEGKRLRFRLKQHPV